MSFSSSIDHGDPEIGFQQFSKKVHTGKITMGSLMVLLSAFLMVTTVAVSSGTMDRFAIENAQGQEVIIGDHYSGSSPDTRSTPPQLTDGDYHVSEEEQVLMEALLLYVSDGREEHNGEKLHELLSVLSEYVGYDQEPPEPLVNEESVGGVDVDDTYILDELGTWIEGLNQHMDSLSSFDIDSNVLDLVTDTIGMIQDVVDDYGDLYMQYTYEEMQELFVEALYVDQDGYTYISLYAMEYRSETYTLKVSGYGINAALTLVSLVLDFTKFQNKLNIVIDYMDEGGEMGFDGSEVVIVELIGSTISIIKDVVSLMTLLIERIGQQTLTTSLKNFAKLLSVVVAALALVATLLNLYNEIAAPNTDWIMVAINVIQVASAAAMLVAGLASMGLLTSIGLTSSAALSITGVGIILAIVALAGSLVYLHFKKAEAKNDIESGLGPVMSDLMNLKESIGSMDPDSLRDQAAVHEGYSRYMNAFISEDNAASPLGFIARRMNVYFGDLAEYEEGMATSVSNLERSIDVAVQHGLYYSDGEKTLSAHLEAIWSVSCDIEYQGQSLSFNGTAQSPAGYYERKNVNQFMFESYDTVQESTASDFREHLPRERHWDSQYENMRDFHVVYGEGGPAVFDPLPESYDSGDEFDLDDIIGGLLESGHPENDEGMLDQMEDLAVSEKEMDSNGDPTSEVKHFWHYKYFLDSDVGDIPEDWSDVIGRNLDSVTQALGSVRYFRDQIDRLKERFLVEPAFFIDQSSQQGVYSAGDTANVKVDVLCVSDTTTIFKLGVSFRGVHTGYSHITGDVDLMGPYTISKGQQLSFDVSWSIPLSTRDQLFQIAVNCWSADSTEENMGVVYRDNLDWENTFYVGTEPVLDMFSPTQEDPAYGGDPQKPTGAFDVKVSVNDGSGLPVLKLGPGSFAVEVDGSSVACDLVRYDPKGMYYLITCVIPEAPSPGLYDVGVELLLGSSQGPSDMEEDALEYVDMSAVKRLEIAFVIDTSGSMSNEWSDMETVIPAILAGLEGMGIDLTVSIYALDDIYGYINNISGIEVQVLDHGILGDQEDILYNISDQDAEAFAQGAAWICANHPWVAGVTRIVIPISDSTPYTGNEGGYYNENDELAVDTSIEYANAFDVYYYPLYGIEVLDDDHQVLYETMAYGTNGVATYFYDTEQVIGELSSIGQRRASGTTTIISEKATIDPEEEQSHDVDIDETMDEVTFSTKVGGSALNISLENPNGQIINESNWSNLTGVNFTELGTYKAFRIFNVTPGEWTFDVFGYDVSEDEEYSWMVTGISLVTLSSDLSSGQVPSGTPVKVFSHLTSPDGVITTATVTVHVEGPYGYSSRLYLHDDGAHGDLGVGDGVFANYFEDTDTLGSYVFNIRANGTWDGDPFTRFEELTLSTVDQVEDPPLVVEPEGIEIKGRRGSSGSVDFHIEASSNITAEIGLTDLIMEYTGSPVEDTALMVDVGSISLKTGEGQDIELQYRLPYNIAPGSYSSHLLFEAENFFVLPIDVEVLPFEISISPLSVEMEMEEGSTDSLNLSLSLSGFGGLDSISTSVTGDIANLTEAVVPSSDLEENGSTNISLDFDIPVGTGSGEYRGTVHITSDMQEAFSIPVIVEVTPLSDDVNDDETDDDDDDNDTKEDDKGWGIPPLLIAGILLIVIMLLVFLFFYGLVRIVGRRRKNTYSFEE